MEKIFEFITETYSKTVDDNIRDFESTYGKILKLCMYLFQKGILSQDELEDILSTDNIDFLKGDSNEK